jgi:Flp pilus assembly protein protease CpaA
LRSVAEMQTVLMIVAIAVLAVVAYGDVRTRRIPNGLVYAICVLGLVRMMLAGDLASAGYTLVAASLVLVIGFLLFWRGMLGGGDAKLLAATVLLVGHRDLFDFLFVMSIFGGLLAIAVLAADRLAPWLQLVPVTIGVYGGPVRLAVRLRESLDRWLCQIPPSTPGVEEDSGSTSRRTVPYGVAIAAAGVFVLVLQTAATG